jgi:Flp pilus assembly protein TadB
MSAHRAGRRSRGVDLPAAVARHTLMRDLAAAAVIAGVVLAIGPGLGVIAWFGVPLLLLGLFWIAVERGLERRRRRRASRRH